MSSSNSEVILPWMTSDYFELVLNAIEGHSNSKLIGFNVSSGANKGENFASAVYRATLSYRLNDETKETSVIIKTSSESSVISELLESGDTQQGETFVYEVFLKECEKQFPEHVIAPRLLHVDKNALVLEDLSRLDFKLANRKVRFDLPQAKLVLKKVALFHATTAVAQAHDNTCMQQFMNSLIVHEDSPLTFFFAASMAETLQTVKETPTLQQYAARLESFDIVQREREVFQRTAEEKFRVLNHGDLWINNIFIENDQQSAMLVDFQECFWGSPGIDLNHFLYTSCNRDVHEHHVDELLKFYYEELIAALSKLKFPKIPTYEDIREEFDRKEVQGLIALCSIVPVLLINNPEHANPENFIADKEGAAEIRREVYGNPAFVETLQFLLPKLADKKVF